MRRRRALLASSLAVVLAAAITGAGQLSAAPETEAKIPITVWLSNYPIPGHLDARIKAAEEFNKQYPRYQVTVTPYEHVKLAPDVAAAAKHGQHPDIANYYSHAIQIAKDTVDKNGKPLFTSVQKAIGDRKEILGQQVNIDDLVPAYREYYTQRGDMTSMPATSMTSMLFANKNLLDAAGVAKVPETWEQVDAACAAVKKLPGQPSCITWPVHNWFLQQPMLQQESLLTNHDNGRQSRATQVRADSPEMVRHVQWWKRLNDAGHFLYTASSEQTWDGMFEAFGTQKVAFIMTSANTAGTLVQMGQQAGFQTTMGRLPYHGDSPPRGNLVTGDSLWLSDGLSKDKQDGALAFMLFLNNPRNAVAWHKSNHYLPVTRTAIDLLAKEGWFEQNPGDRIAVDQVNTTTASPAALGPVIGDFHAFQKVLTRAVDDVLKHGAEPAARLRRANTEAQNYLSFYNANCANGKQRHENCFRIYMLG